MHQPVFRMAIARRGLMWPLCCSSCSMTLNQEPPLRHMNAKSVPDADLPSQLRFADSRRE